jgi:hypothetical protein
MSKGPARRFPHEEAQALHAQGMSVRKIADRFGVTETAIRRVCNPSIRARMDAAALRWMRENKREPCLGGCGALVWTAVAQRTGYCPACWQAADGVREDGLLCRKCDEWKPDDEFGRGASAPKARRGHRSWCRVCDALARRAHRAKALTDKPATDPKVTEA